MKENTIEEMKLYEVEGEDGAIRNPTAHEEMEHCHVFKSKIRIEVMRLLDDVNIHSVSAYDNEADTRPELPGQERF